MSIELPPYQHLDAKRTGKLLTLFDGERTGWVQVGEKKYLLPKRYIEEGKHYYNFKARPDDTWVLSYPRSGTTWTQEMVWLISNNLDFETAKTVLLAKRFPFLEVSMCCHPQVMEELYDAVKDEPEIIARCRQVAEPRYRVLQDQLSPRFIKSHFPFSLLPGILETGCKSIYVARNPKDVAVSWFHMNKSLKLLGYNSDFPTFWKCFRNDLTTWSPYWEHLKEAWALRDHPTVLFLFYENMKMDLASTIEKVANFLGKSLTPKQILELMEYLDFDSFQKNPAVNGTRFQNSGIMTNSSFIRKGRTGAWTDSFTPELEAEADEWIAENLKGTDFSFPIFNTCNNQNFSNVGRSE